MHIPYLNSSYIIMNKLYWNKKKTALILLQKQFFALDNIIERE